MCKICETKPVYEFTNKRRVCKNCFIRWFQKKVLYTIKKFSMIKRADVIGYVSGECFRDEVLEDVLKYYDNKAPIEIIKLKRSHSNIPIIPKSVDKLAISNNLDVVGEKVIITLLDNKISNLKLKPVEDKIIRPLYLFLDKELLLYAKLKKLKFKVFKKNKNKLSSFIDDLEKKHPEIKRAIVNSYLKLV